LLLDDALKPATPLINGANARAINENQLIFEVKTHKKLFLRHFWGHPDVMPAGCDSYFRQ